MKRLFTILLLLFIANNLFAQKKSKNAPQSLMAIETGVPFLNKIYAHFPIPLNIEFQRKNKQWGLGASVVLQYDRYSSGDCSKRNIITGRDLGFTGSYPYPYVPYCQTSQYLNLKPSIFGSYYFYQKKGVNFFAKLGGLANIPILVHQEGEFYEIEIQHNFGTTIKVKDAGPIHISRNIRPYQASRISLLSGLGINYFLNKRISFRFTLQSEWYSPNWYNGGSLFFALGGIAFKI